MPRCARNLVNSGFYHIMIRGVNKEIIFKEDEDRKLFLRLLYYYCKKFNSKIHAYCLMDNHVHILFEDKSFFISDFMRELSSHYASEFNKKHKRIGHLYQERFRSEIVWDEDYLLRLVRYIHKNPEKAGICKTEEYKWSSYREYVSKANIIEKLYVLSKFSSNYEVAIKKFKEFILDKSEDNIDNIYFSETLSDLQATELIRHILKIDNILEIKSYEREKKEEILKRILEIKNLNCSQIARILKISKNFKSYIK